MESEREVSSSPFGVRPGEMLQQAWTAYWANRYQLTLWSFVSLVTYYALLSQLAEVLMDEEICEQLWKTTSVDEVLTTLTPTDE